jgi:predicted PurR-regulated permease PerM
MIWEIALVIFLLVLSVLIILLIPAVLNLIKTLARISELVENVNKDLPDILADISEITYQSSRASQRIHDAVDDIAAIERKVTREIKEPLLQAAASMGGFLKALQAFMTFFVKKS